MDNKRKIYLDMDGVVADFNKFASDFLGRKVGWDVNDLTAEEWNTLSSVDRLYYHLPLIPESVKLVGFAKSFSYMFDVEFLTAIPRQTTMPSARQDKKDWVDIYYPGIPVNYGPYSRDKQNWARPGYILVDDKRSNIDEWFSKGGQAVYHTGDFNKTIHNLVDAIEVSDNSPGIFE